MAQEEMTEQEAMDFRSEMAKEMFGDEADTSMPPINDQPAGDQGNPAADPPPVEDPWAGVNPALRQTFEALQAKANMLDTLETRLKRAEGALGAVTNKLHNQGKDAAKEIPQDEAPTKEQIDAAAKSAEEWKDLEAEFPEWTKAMNARLASEKAESSKTIQALQNDIKALKEAGGSQQDISALRGEITREINMELLASRHPDWEHNTLKGNPEKNIPPNQEFIEFIKARPDLAPKCNSVKASDAIYVLDQFKGRKKTKSPEQIKQERQQRLSQSALPNSTSRARVSAKTPDDMSDDEYRQQVAGEFWGNQ